MIKPVIENLNLHWLKALIDLLERGKDEKQRNITKKYEASLYP